MFHVPCSGFNVISVHLTSVLLSSILAFSWPLIWLEYHSVNWGLKKDFADCFAVRSRNCIKCVILAGTCTRKLIYSFKRSKTVWVVWPLNTSIIKRLDCYLSDVDILFGHMVKWFLQLIWYFQLCCQKVSNWH